MLDAGTDRNREREKGMQIGRKLKLLLYPYVIKVQGLKRGTLQAFLPLFSVL